MSRMMLAALTLLLALPSWLPASAQAPVPEAAGLLNRLNSVKDVKEVREAPSTPALDMVVVPDASQQEPPVETIDKAPATTALKVAKMNGNGNTFKAPAGPRRATPVTLPSGLTVEEWNISTNFYNVGASGFIDFSNTINVAVDGNDIYVQGLCLWLPNAWVQGTINGNTASFPTGQYFGGYTQSGQPLDMYFVGLDTDDGSVADVSFSYSAAAHKLTLPDNMRLFIGADAEGNGYYAYHINTVIAKEYVDPPVSIEIGADASDPSAYIPFYGYYYEQSTTSQMIFPASMLTNFQAGQRIKSVTFYTYDTSGIQFSGGQITVTLGTTSNTYFTGNNSLSISGTLATATVVPTKNSTTLKIEFDSPLVYTEGANIIIQMVNTTTGNYARTNWLGVAYNGSNQYYSYSSRGNGNNQARRLQFLPKATFELQSPPVLLTDELDFEAVEVGQSKTLTALIENPNSDNVTASVTATAPYSVASSTVTLQPGVNAVHVTFTPTGPDVYNGTLTININGTDVVIPLKGVGTVPGPEAIRDEAFFDGITYKWTDSDGGKHTSKLTDVATDPDQMIAMIRKVYMDKTIPGNYKRGFTVNGGNETWNDVNYAGVGRISAEINSNSSTISFGYANNYGWNIPGSIKMGSQVAENDYNSGTFYYSYMDSTQYKPYNEGVTLLLVEIVDDYSKSDFTSEETGAYAYLRDLISKSIKSIRIVPQAKRTGTGFDAGTLFKIDCDKMNKFFLMAKGQLRWIYNSYFAEYNFNGRTYNLNEYFSANPCYIYCDDSYNPINGFFDDRSFPLFYNMFEEFSPVANDAAIAQGDIYQDLVNMESYGVEHDCMGVTMMGHEFMMYGEDSEAADCADVRDMLFFVPDYRMMKWDGRESHNYQKFMNYNTAHQPTMGLYVIRQKEIVETSHSEDYYILTLTWESNLDKFLPSNQQYYELFQVVTDEFGNETYVPVYYRNSHGEYTDAQGNVLADQSNPVPITLTLGQNDDKVYTQVCVDRDQASKQVTYVIRGCDTGNFLSLKASNKQSYIIPGKDPAEMLALLERSHYSRYNPQNQTNCYSNMVQLTNTPTGLKHSAVQNGLIMELYRDYGTGENMVSTRVAKIEVTDRNARQFTVTMENQNGIADFPAGKESGIGAGYHLNHNTDGNASWSDTYRVLSNDVISLDRLIMYDNFVVDVSENTHPAFYTYRVVTTYTDNTLQQGQTAYSNTFVVPVYKTMSQISGSFTKAEVDADTSYPVVGNLPGVEFGAQLRYSSKTEILRYDAYRWNANEDRFIIDEVGEGDDEQDLPPTGMAGNQDGSYTVSMNDVENEPEYYTTSTVTVAPGETDKWATFVDKYADDNPGAYVYAPVIETFAVGKNANGDNRRDYNTYGGPLQNAATGRIDVTAQKPEGSKKPAFYKNGVAYTYYNIALDWSTIANNMPLIPNGYDIYKIRAWRKIDRQYMGEALSDREFRMGNDNGEYLFEDFTYLDVSKSTQGTPPALGSTVVGAYNERTGTFGAIDVMASGAPVTEIPVTFVVRLYFTSEADLNELPIPSDLQGAPRRAGELVPADGKYYISEIEINTSIKGNNDDIITAVNDVNYREVEQVLYYNPTGMVSDRPFDGVNVVVTRYTDGSTSTTKVVK